jgi:hypothetical protein
VIRGSPGDVLFLPFRRVLRENRFGLNAEPAPRGSRLGQFRWEKKSCLAFDAAAGQKSENPCQAVQQAFVT